MKDITKIVSVLSVIFLLSYSCEDPNKDTAFTVYEELPISTYLNSQPEFSEWVKIMKYADLYNAVNQAAFTFTVFAPVNDAVKEYFERYQVEGIEELGVDHAQQLVKAHVVSDSISFDEFIAGGVLAKKTISDHFLEVTFGEGGYEAVYINEGVRVRYQPEVVDNGFSILAGNGLIYVLEGVMRPMIDGMYTELKAKGAYDIFAEALELTSWSDSLNTISDSQQSYPGAPVTELRRYYTLLAVSDQVFNGKGILSINDLVTRLGAGNDYTSKENALFQYVAYHIMSGNYSVRNLHSFDNPDMLRAKLWKTLATNQLIKITEQNNNFYLNADGGKDFVAQIIEEASNYPVRNGYIHEVNDILPICTALNPERIYFDVTNFPEVASFIASNGVEGMIYQQMTENELNTSLPLTGMSCYSIVPSPSGTNGNMEFQYITVKSSEDRWNGALHGDFLRIKLGRGAHVTMETPPILPGRYRVTLYYLYANSMNPFRDQLEGNGGLTRFTIDDNITTSKLLYSSLGGSASMGIYSTVLFDDITFETTDSHSVRIGLDDAAASSSAVYRVQVDYILFEPI